MTYQLKHKAPILPLVPQIENQKIKITNSTSSSDSSCSDSDSKFEYVLVKRKSKRQYISNQRGGEDSNQEITPK